MALTYCDARACYNRIAVIMSALSEQAAGLTPEQTYGPSKEKNYQTAKHPVHGSGPGTTDGPPKWTCTVNTALICYDKKAKGATLSDPTWQICTQQNAKMFVDDNRQMHNNGMRDATAHQLMPFVDHDVNLWDELLWIIGGLLEQSKPTYSLMVWDFEEPGKPFIMPMEKLPANTVKIRCNGTAATLKQTAENKAIRNLGDNQALILQEETELENLKTKTHKITYAVWWGQHAVGVGFSILKGTQDILHLEGTWLKQNQDGLNTIGRTIKLEHDWIRAPVQLHDKHIMQIFLELDAVEKCNLEVLNYCRCWLPMEHLSAIVTSDGTAIHLVILQTIKKQLNNQFQTVAGMKQKKPNKRS
eukprot:15366464-Ditylum_brightwellii.AAC.2